MMSRTLTIVAHPKPKVEIGLHWDGKRHVYYDTRNGEYCESAPQMDRDAHRLQQALCPPRLRLRPRKM